MVRHRPDGLEVLVKNDIDKRRVRHRPDGLEDQSNGLCLVDPVRHRPDGLEAAGLLSAIHMQGSPSPRWFRSQCYGYHDFHHRSPSPRWFRSLFPGQSS